MGLCGRFRMQVARECNASEQFSRVQDGRLKPLLLLRCLAAVASQLHNIHFFAIFPSYNT